MHFISSGLGRAVLAPLALFANLLAISVPMVHDWAHEISDAPHTLGVDPHGEEPSHSEVHPLALHDDCQLIHHVAFDLAALLHAERADVAVPAIEKTKAFEPVISVRSRAPPASIQARAPPLS